MQGWEYGYLFVVSLTGLPSANNVAVVSDAAGLHLLKGVTHQMQALNLLGREGWIIGDNTGGQGQMGIGSGWLYEFIAESVGKEQPLFFHSVTHFMRRPIDSVAPESGTTV